MRGAGDSFPQLLCDSYANRAPTRIPGNYWRQASPSPGRAGRMCDGPAICRDVSKAFLVASGRVRSCRGRGSHRL